MKNLVKKFFGPGKARDFQKEAVHDTRVATCALLLEMANIDGEFSEDERARIITVLRKEFGVAEDELESLMEAALQEIEGSIDWWQYTNLINKNYSREEKIQIIENIWKIAYADGRLEAHEDYLVHKLADLLGLDHSELIRAKLKIKGNLA